MAITKITTPELLDFPKDSTSSVNTSGTVIPAGNNYVSGGGGLVENSLTLSTGVAYTVTIGPGGNKNGSGTNNDSTSGGNSVFHTITSIGGANATFNTSTLIGVSGGSGAGATGHYSASCTPGTAGLGTANQGYAGGSGYGRCNSDEAAGGGGGAGGKGGAAAPNYGGMGGIGIISYIKDPNGTKYAGGGGGGGRTTGGAAVAGYGGSDGVAGTNASDATANTGGGGGSTGGNIGGVRGGNGGSGVVIVRYPSTISAALTTVSGSANQTISGSTDLYAEMISGTGSILFSPNPAGPATTFTADYLVVAGGGGGDMDERGGAGAGGVRTSYGTTRPATADAGEFRYNEQLGYVEYYDGSNWQQIADEYISGQPTTCICNYPSNTTPIALYQLDDVTETCGTWGNATNVGSATFTSGKFGDALTLTGGQYLTLSDTWTYTNNFSCSVWVYMNSLAMNGSYPGIIDFGANTGINWMIEFDNVAASPVFNGVMYTPSSQRAGTTTTLAINTWYHIVFTASSTNGKKLYLNGVLETTNPNTADTGPTGTTSTNRIGSSRYGSATDWDGQIDQLRLYSGVLTQTQVTELYNEVVCN